LVLPSVLPLAANLYWAPQVGLEATGFIQSDQPSYMANAREAFDALCHGRRFAPLYGNPYATSDTTPQHYFQPFTFALGLAQWITRADPGAVFAIAGVLAAILCGAVAVCVFDEASPGGPVLARRLGLVSFFWGGGVLCYAAVVVFGGAKLSDGRVFTFDPFGGWWFLNFGRNLVYPMEAFYHAVFFGGLQLLAVLGAWGVLERVVLRNDTVPGWFVAAVTLLLAAHAGYYLMLLPRDPDHLQVMRQFASPWLLEWTAYIPAYALVGALAAWRLRTWQRARAVLSMPRARLFSAWFLVSVSLAKHELYALPIQPLHFTRGYIWTPLFLLGAPTLVAVYARLLSYPRRVLGALTTAAVLLLITSDNLVWLGDRTFGGPLSAIPAPDPVVPTPDEFRMGVAISASQRAVLRWLDQPQQTGALVVTDDLTIGYLTPTYTALRSWLGHRTNTPWATEREAELARFFDGGAPPTAWQSRPLLVVTRRTGFTPRQLAAAGRRVSLVYRAGGYTVFRVYVAPGSPSLRHSARHPQPMTSRLSVEACG
jgi:hypothetical protein